MRSRSVAIVGVLAVVALGLGGFLIGTSDLGGAPSDSSTASAGGIGTDGPFPTATGAFGERPELTFPAAVPSTGLQVDVLSTGDGADVAAGDLLIANYLGQIWGGDVFDESYSTGAPAGFTIGTGALIEGWDMGLVGQSVGSRVLLTIPPDLGYGAFGQASAGIAGTDTLVFVVDIIGSYPPDAAGDADAVPTAEAAGTGPVVTGALGEPATVTVPDGLAEPAAVMTTVLATGSGSPVVAGQVVIQYSAVYWDNSTTESTWEQGVPAALGIGTGGVFDALIGVPVGSRVLLELPATEDSVAIAVVIDVVDQLAVA